MPPREKRAARRRARAAKLGLGLPPLVTGRSPVKRTHKGVKAPVLPTLAATRKRREGTDRAYLNRADGFHIKHVVRRPVTSEHAPPVAYLPGQEDIPRSDVESETDNSKDTTPTTCRSLPKAPYTATHVPRVAEYVGLGDQFDIAAEDDLLDYDAEGEDDNGEQADSNIDMDIGDFSFSGDSNHPGAGPWGRCPPPAEPLDLLANASEEDVQALFTGFDSLRFDDRSDSLDNGYFPGDFRSFNSSGAHAWSDVNGDLESGLQLTTLGLGGTQEPLTARQPAAASDHFYARDSTHDPTRAHIAGHAALPGANPRANLSSHPPATNAESPRPPLPPLRRVPTPAPWVSVPEVQVPARRPPIASVPPQPTPPPPARQVAPHAPASRASTPYGRATSSHPPVFAEPRTRLNTSQQASQACREAGPSRPRHPVPVPVAASPILSHGFSLTDSESGDDEEDSDDSDAGRASTPVNFEDTDIGLTEDSVLPARLTQSMCKAERWLNLQKPPKRPTQSASQEPTIPTLLEVRARARQHFAVTARKTRIREPAPSSQPPRNHGPLRSSEMTPDQHAAMGPMQYHVYMGLVCNNPWPLDRDSVLEDAKDYAIKITGIDGPNVYTPRYKDAVYNRMPASRGEVLSKIALLAQQEFAISVADKPEIKMYLDKDNFLYPTIDRDENQKFRVHIIGSTLCVLLFECGKALAYVFMEELNQPDDPRKCADWHSKARDRTARGRGIPPGLIAYAATLIHWALLKLNRGGTLKFQESEFREVWAHYLRAVLKLKHLGELRMDFLELVRRRYLDRWPGEARDEGDEDDEDGEGSSPAW
ncbi:hypothetical protein FRC09_012714 [Ceratobasidium sp. 395]|nr:hypothetical protein FRC09_012714 [Ceratobasidium sp. 395]